MPSQWILLDFDNTLMGTEQYAVPSLIARFNDLYGDKIDHPLTFEAFKKHFHGQARENLCANLSKHFGITVDYPTLYDAREWRMMQHYKKLKETSGGVQMAEGVLDALTALQQQGFHFAVVTNNPLQRAFTAMRFADNNRGADLARFFGSDFFEAGDVQKPKPDVYLRAMEQLGTNPAVCYAVEDSASGASSAVAAGIPTFGYTGFASDPAGLAATLTAKGCVATFAAWQQFPSLIRARAAA